MRKTLQYAVDKYGTKTEALAERIAAINAYLAGYRAAQRASRKSKSARSKK